MLKIIKTFGNEQQVVNCGSGFNRVNQLLEGREMEQQFAHLLIEEAALAAGIPSVFLENSRQVPPLQLSQAPYHRACKRIDNRKVAWNASEY